MVGVELPLLLLFAVTAEPRPRYGVQPGSSDELPTGLTHSKGAVVDPSQGLFDRSQQMTLRLSQTDLNLCFGLCCRLVDKVCAWVPRCGHKDPAAAPSSQQVVPLG
jgi:hypothetical protein